MTDELSIQQQRPSAMPYLLTGAAAGAVAGYVADKYFISKPMSHDDIINEVNQKDKFEARTKEGTKEAASWKDVKTKADALKNAENELKKAAESKLPDTATEATDLANAKKARADEFDRLFKIEKANNGIASTQFKPLTPEQVMNLGSEKVSLAELDSYKKAYGNYTKALETAEKNADRSAIDKFGKNIKDTAKSIYSAKDKKGVQNAVSNLEKEINKLIPEYTDKRIAHEIKAAGHDYKKGSKKYNKFADDLNKTVKKQREALRDEILGEKVQIDVKKGSKVVGKRTSYANVEKLMSIENNYNNAIKKFDNLASVKGIGGRANVGTVADWNAQLKALEAKKDSIAPKNFDVQKKALESRKALAQKLENIENAHKNSTNKVINEISYTKKLEGKVAKAVKNDGAYQKAYAKLKNVSNNIAGVKDVAFETVAAADEATLKKAVEEKLKGTKFDTDVAKFQGLYDEAAQKGGVVDEAAKKAAEEKVATAKAELQKATKELGEKLGGSKKWLAMSIGAVALGLAGLAFRPSAKEA